VRLPDLGVDVALLLDGGTATIEDLDVVQPKDGRTSKVTCMRKGTRERLSILCAYEGAHWIQKEEIEEAIDHSMHPDMKHAMGDVVMASRSVLDAVPRGHLVEIGLSCSQRDQEPNGVMADVLITADGDVSNGLAIHVPDSVLDQIPLVRRIERCGNDIAQAFEISAYDDNSGVDATFAMSIGKDSLTLSHKDDQWGTTLTIESAMADGAWHHATTFVAPDQHWDTMTKLRMQSDPQLALAALFEAAEDKDEDADADADGASIEDTSAHLRILGIGLPEQVVVESMEQDAEEGGITFRLRPGMLR
jgi:hypothetical protein